MGWRSTLESLFWVLAAAAVVLYGSGQYDLISVLRYDKRLNRSFIQLGVINVGINVLLFAYVFVWLGWIRGVARPLEQAPFAGPTGAVTLVATVVGFGVGLWPVFGPLALLQIVILYGTVCAFAFVPAVAFLKLPNTQPAASTSYGRKKEMRQR